MGDITKYPTETRPFDAHLCTIVPLIAASAVVCGDAVYLDTAGKIAKADANAVGTAQAIGIVVSVGNQSYTTAAAGDMCDVVVSGPVFLGEAVALTIGSGTRLWVSATTPGLLDQTKIATSGDFPYSLGYPYTANCIWVQRDTAIPVAVSP